MPQATASSSRSISPMPRRRSRWPIASTRAQCGLKVGKELFVAAGPDLVRTHGRARLPVFLDLKFHDIPNTVASACAAATRLGVGMLNVHASGGRAMLTAAREAVDRAARDGGTAAPLLIAVTVLTSLGDADVREVGYRRAPRRRWPCGWRGSRATAASTASSARRRKRRRCARRADRPSGS